MKMSQGQLQSINSRLNAELNNRNGILDEFSHLRAVITSTMVTPSFGGAVASYGHPNPHHQIQGTANVTNNFVNPAPAPPGMSPVVPTPNPRQLLSQLNSLEQRYTDSQRVLYALQDEVNNIKMDIVDIKSKQNEERQYNQKYSIISHGWDDVPVAPKKPTREYRKAYTTYVEDKLNTLLQSNLERDIVESDIDNTHIYRTKKNFDPNSSKQLVIIKFVSVLRRDDVYSNKKILKDKNVSLTEHLTKTNLFIYKAAQKAVSDIKKSFDTLWHNSG